MAEVVNHYFPKLVEMHNYSAANSVRQKLYNWSTLNQKVLKKISYQIAKPDVDAIVNCKPGVVEAVLMQLQSKMAAFRARQRSAPKGASGAKGKPAAAPPAHTFSSERAASAPSGGGARGAGAASGADTAAAAAYLHSGPGAAGSSGAGAGAGGGRGYGPSSGGAAGGATHGGDGLQKDVDEELLVEKEQTIQELRETVEILELKIKKLEQLVRLKDSRIQTLTAHLQSKQIGI